MCRYPHHLAHAPRSCTFGPSEPFSTVDVDVAFRKTCHCFQLPNCNCTADAKVRSSNHASHKPKPALGFTPGQEHLDLAAAVNYALDRPAITLPLSSAPASPTRPAFVRLLQPSAVPFSLQSRRHYTSSAHRSMAPPLTLSPTRPVHCHSAHND